MKFNVFLMLLVCAFCNLAKAAAKDYMVVDLSSTPYKISYLSDVPNGGWTDEYKTTKIVLRRIPAGSFVMGCKSSEYGYTGYEFAQHNVTISRPFYMGVFHITQQQYKTIKGTNPSGYYGLKSPVDRVSWNTIRGSAAVYNWPTVRTVDSSSFMGLMRTRTGGLQFDLPTEAQWEYACRAGTTTGLNSGKDVSNRDLSASSSDKNMGEVGRYQWNNGTGGNTTVGSYKPNNWGLYDMHGNTWEWCLDWWADASSGTTAVIDPEGPTCDGNKNTPKINGRVLRGGGWRSQAYQCRSANRWSYQPSYTEYLQGFGFRMCCNIDPEPIEVSLGSNSFTYDGNGHGIAVAAQNVTGAYTIEYSLSHNGTYSSTCPQFVNVGSYQVWYAIKADGYYIGCTNNVTLNITRRSLAASMVNIANSKVKYTGKAVEPVFSVKLGDKILEAGTDYNYDVSNNTNPGYGCLTITGINNFSGTVQIQFEIVANKVEFALGAHLTRVGGGELTQYVAEGAAANSPAVQLDSDWFSGVAWDKDFSCISNDMTIVGEALATVPSNFVLNVNGTVANDKPEISWSANIDIPSCVEKTISILGKQSRSDGEWIRLTDNLNDYRYFKVEINFSAANQIVISTNTYSMVDEVVSGVLTGGRELFVPHEWIKSDHLKSFYGTGDTAATVLMKPTGKCDASGNPLCVWHDYVAGTDPLDVESKFKAIVTVVDGIPVVKWSPALNGEGVKEGVRLYKVLGTKTLGGKWEEVNGNTSDYKFFKVTVDMN